MRTVMALAALLAAVVACSAGPSGVVVGREYDAPNTTSKTVCSTTDTGAKKRTTCRNKPVYESAEWELVVRAGDQDTEIDVTRAAYEACAEGEAYPACAEGA